MSKSKKARRHGDRLGDGDLHEKVSIRFFLCRLLQPQYIPWEATDPRQNVALDAIRRRRRELSWEEGGD